MKFARHSCCTKCRPVECSFDDRCSECEHWSDDFMHVFLKHRQSLVAKGRRKQGVAGPPLSSSAPFSQTPSLLPSTSSSQDVHVIRELVPPSAQLGMLTSSFSAPAPVPHCGATLVGPTGGEILLTLLRAKVRYPPVRDRCVLDFYPM